MSTPATDQVAPSPEALARIRAALRDELYDVRSDRWWEINAYKFPLLTELASDQEASTVEDRIRAFLLDIVDPLGPGQTTRTKLEARDIKDRGLLGRWLLGEPKSYVHDDVELAPSTKLTGPRGRDGELETLRADGKQLMRGPTNGRTPGPGWVLFEEVTDELLALATPSIESGAEVWEPFMTEPEIEGSSLRARLAAWRPNRRLAISISTVIGLVAAVTVFAYVLEVGPFAKDPAGKFAPDPPPMAEGLGIASGIQAINRSKAPRWGTEIVADPINTIEFDVWVANRSKTATGPLTAWLETEQLGDSNGKRVRAVVTGADGRPLIRSGWLISRSMTNPYGPLATTGKQVGNVSASDDSVTVFDEDNKRVGAGEIQLVEAFPKNTGISSVKQPTQIPEGAYSVRFVAVPAQQQRHAMFRLTWSPFGTLPTLENVVGFTDVLLNEELVDAARNIDVEVGDKLMVTETIAPSATDVVPLPAQARAVMKPQSGAQPARLNFVIGGPKITGLGTSTVKAVSAFGPKGKPVAIELIPRSTTLYKVDPKSCGKGNNQWIAESVSDDLVRAGGLALGGVGGYLPDDKCGGEASRKKFSASFRVIAAD